ncbi:MAG: TonB-dependent receptor [Bacteroidota bacterium]|nr:TonB-dependent receptor [Bacteroidota bacterium]
MRLTMLLLFGCMFTVSANSYAQKTRLDINMTNTSIRDLFGYIEDNSKFVFLYRNEDFNVLKKVVISLKDATINQILDEALKGENVTYDVYERQIVIQKAGDATNLEQQKRTISGVVTDSSGGALPGVSVVVKGTTIGTITDANGQFTLSVPDDSKTLMLSFVGMKGQEVAIAGKITISVVMEEETIGIEEVVAVGYGTQKKVNLSGAVAVVSGKTLNNAKISNLAEMLQGQLAGLSVIQSTGEPGNEDVNLVLRGRGSFGGNLSPLIIVDGIPVANMTAINPTAIESVTALKDAASCAIYGSRAAGGVILITTKQGNEGKEDITYDGSVGVYSPTRMPDLITNSAEYMQMYNQAKMNRYGPNVANLYSQSDIDKYKNANGDPLYPNTDWANALFNTVVGQNHNINISGGGKNSTHNISLGVIDQPGTMPGFGYKKYTLQINVTSKLSNRVQVGISTRALYSDRKGAGGSVIAPAGSEAVIQFSSSRNILNQAINQAPTYGPKLADGSYVINAFRTIETPSGNPFATIENTPVTERDLRLETSAFLKVSFTDWLSWETRGGFNIDEDNMHSFAGKSLQYYWDGTLPPRAQPWGVGGDLGVSDANRRMINPVFYSTLNFQKTLENHQVSGMGGYQMEYTRNDFFSARRQDFLTSVAQQIDAGVNNSNNFTQGNAQELALMSFFGRLNYNYKEKYLLEIDARADGSSRFSPEKRWGIFPSASLAWRPLKESFMPEIFWMSDLKFRGSFGVLGNQSVGDNYLYQKVLSSAQIPGSAWWVAPMYAFDKSSPTQGFASPKLVDPNLSWETTYSTNLGTDLSLFKNSLTINFDYYYKKTINILVPDAKLPYSSGFGTQVQALGSMQNKGFELVVGYKGHVKDFNYGANWSIQSNKNKVLSYPTPGPWGMQMYAPGYEYGTFFLNIFDGIRQAPEVVKLGNGTPYTLPAGTMIIRDIHGPSTAANYGMGVGGPDGIVNRDGDRVVVDGMYPKFQSGLTLTGSWKGLDVSCSFYGVYGLKHYLQGAGWIPFDGNTAPPSTMWRDAWTPTNHSTKLPMLAFGSGGTGVWYNPLVQDDNLGRNTFNLVDGSYLRLKNLNIGYTFNFQKFGIQALRVYFSGDNLLTFTKFPGDPERQTGVYNEGTAARAFQSQFLRYPQNKILSTGVSIKF